MKNKETRKGDVEKKAVPSKEEFIARLKNSGNPDDAVLAILLKDNIIEMPKIGEGNGERNKGGSK